jgi:DNA-binding PadR family transcriptional regulator
MAATVAVDRREDRVGFRPSAAHTGYVDDVAVREGLLALLSERPSLGYQLKTGFEAATGGVWPLNVGQVYTTLDRLTRDGYVESAERDGQRSYRITADGVAELGSWWEAVPGEEPPQRDELMLKVLLAVSRGRGHGLEVINQQRTAVMTLLQKRRRALRSPGRKAESLAQQLVTEALIARAEADLRWLDRCEERLLASDED